MRYLLTGPEMKQTDANTMEHYHMLSAVLMERAALSLTDEFLDRFPDTKTKVLIACGTGNNGGDGIAIARLLTIKGYPVTVLFPGSEDKCTVETARQLQIAKQYGVSFRTELDEDGYDVVMDAIFGIGLSRNIEGKYYDLIQSLNAMDAYRIAVDISSGLSADNGRILGIAFQADLTVTFGFGKIGQYLYPGAEITGKLVVKDIGIDENSLLHIKPSMGILEQSDLRKLPKRFARSNKGSYGKILVLAGSRNMAGAAVFAAKAAYRMGAGLVKTATVSDNRVILQQEIPEAVLSTYDCDTDMEDYTKELIKWADAIVIGPGLGTGPQAVTMVETVMKNAAVPCIVDADALNILADHPDWFSEKKTDLVITPHPGEMSRLTKKEISYILNHTREVASDFAKTYGVTVVLKDARTITALPDGFCYLNTSGNHGMATGGSGDVLSGIVGTLLGQGLPAADAASLAVYIHGLAGDRACVQTGPRSLMASDILDGIWEVLKENYQ